MRTPLLLLPVLAACHSAPELTPLAARGTFAVEYRGSITPYVESRPDAAVAEGDGATAAAAAAQPVRCVRVDAHLLEVDEATAGALMGRTAVDGIDHEPAALLRGTRIDPAAIDPALRAAAGARSALILGAPSLVCNDGQQASLAVRSETAYVRSFTVHPVRDTLVVDPVVAVAEDGLQLTFTPRLRADSSGMALGVHLDLRDVLAPVGVVGAPLRRPDLQLQVPLVLHQELRAEPELAAHDAFVLSARSPRRDRVLLVMVAVQVVPLPGTIVADAAAAGR